MCPLNHLVHLPVVDSTMDEAHRLAREGAPSGTFVLADEQRSGRGRSGKQWASAPGSGIWLTLLKYGPGYRSADSLDAGHQSAGLSEHGNDDRPLVEEAVRSGVLALRSGLLVAELLAAGDSTAGYFLKWPNDVFRDSEKVAGILVEARWSDGRLEWVALGVGVNLKAPDGVDRAGAVPEHILPRSRLLPGLMDAMREAAIRGGPLSADELERWRSRDLSLGREALEPARGKVAGITAGGALLLDTAGGRIQVRSGSLILRDT